MVIMACTYHMLSYSSLNPVQHSMLIISGSHIFLILVFVGVNLSVMIGGSIQQCIINRRRNKLREALMKRRKAELAFLWEAIAKAKSKPMTAVTTLAVSEEGKPRKKMLPKRKSKKKDLSVVQGSKGSKSSKTQEKGSKLEEILDSKRKLVGLEKELKSDTRKKKKSKVKSKKKNAKEK